jgi:hypothetical protein
MMMICTIIVVSSVNNKKQQTPAHYCMLFLFKSFISYEISLTSDN